MLKTKVLKMLKEANGYVSGQQLCEEYQVSRTAIWKVINKLKEEGYEIESVSNKGYCLLNTPDVLTKSEIENHLHTTWVGTEIYSYKEIGSTNTVAKEFGDKGKPHGTLVVADMQTEGKGRRGRNWESPMGNSISLSVLLRPEISAEKTSMLTLVMALAVQKGLYEITKVAPEIKWPNDILLNQKKVCGILTEMSAEPDMVHYVVIGVGINVNMESIPKEQAPYASSLKAEIGQVYNRAEIIANCMVWFEKYYQMFLQTEDFTKIMDEYNACLVNREQKVYIYEKQKQIVGIAKGISNTGKLLVALDDGELLEVYAGEVSVRGIYGYI
jgi:BirA family biotin operon repressor/biotin-[acetyl-CoA-carboxylase] ligase